VVSPALILKASKVASGLLKVFSSLWADVPYPPWRYFWLGELVARYSAGHMLRVPQPKGTDWRFPHNQVVPGGGVYNFGWFFGNTTAITSVKLAVFRYKTSRTEHNRLVLAGMHQKYLVSKYAPYILAGKAPPGVLKLEDLPAEAKADDPYWGFILTGLADWRERWAPKVRGAVGTTLEEYLRPLRTAEQRLAQLNSALVVVNRLGKPPAPELLEQLEQVGLELKRQRALTEGKRQQLVLLWKQTPARQITSQTDARRMLEQVSGEQASRELRVADDAAWYGWPSPRSLRLAAEGYKKIGAAAVARYFSVAKEGLARALQLYAPEALSDPYIRKRFAS